MVPIPTALPHTLAGNRRVFTLEKKSKRRVASTQLDEATFLLQYPNRRSYAVWSSHSIITTIIWMPLLFLP